MRIAINLASRPFADLAPALRRLRIAMASLSVLALGLWLGLHLLHGKADAARAHEHSLDVRINQLNQEQINARNLMAQPANAAVLDQAGALNKLIDQKAFSWTLAMEDLETVLPGGVQVTTLEPIIDKKDGHVTVHLRVVGPRDKAIELVANLEHSSRFLQPRITGEATESTGNSNEKLEPVSLTNRENFEILAEYNPVTDKERKQAKMRRAAEDKAIPGEEQQPAANQPSAGHRKAAPAAQPARALKPDPGLQRSPYTGGSHPAQPSIQDTPRTPPQAFTGGPK